MAKYMHNKQFKVKGWLQNLHTMEMARQDFIISVSNDNHCTVSVAPADERTKFQFCVDFTKVLKALEDK